MNYTLFFSLSIKNILLFLFIPSLLYPAQEEKQKQTHRSLARFIQEARVDVRKLTHHLQQNPDQIDQPLNNWIPGMTPLMVAAFAGNAKAVHELMSTPDINPNKTCSMGNTAHDYNELMITVDKSEIADIIKEIRACEQKIKLLRSRLSALQINLQIRTGSTLQPGIRGLLIKYKKEAHQSGSVIKR